MLKKLLQELGLGKIQAEVIEIPIDIVVHPQNDDEWACYTLGLLVGGKVIYEDKGQIKIDG